MIAPQLIPDFDNAILAELDANDTRFGLSLQEIRVYLRPKGYPATEDEQTLDRLEYLASKKMASEVSRTVHKANRTWKITDAGRQYLDDHNL